MAWTRVESGWYWWETASEKAAVCRETDGLWHTYVDRDGPPGDSRHKSLALAKRKVARLLEGKRLHRASSDAPGGG